MAKVDFYVLSSDGEFVRQQFACRLAEKAYKLENRVHINVANAETVQKLDTLLWTFRDDSFVPHHVLETSPDHVNAPVTISCDSLPSEECDLLINLAETIPDRAETFPRIAEIVSSDDACRSLSRQRFVDYRGQGHTLNTHKL